MAKSKDVVVTGVSTGIGWGTTKVLISKGFRVFGSVRKQADADRLQGMSDALRRELMVFGIEVVIIEPGTVNTAMYDKGEKEDLSEFKQTEYWRAVQNFQKFIVAEARNNGLAPERLSEAVHVALSAAKPKARYAVIPQRFKNWTLPRLLPA